jgi:3-methyl-2-oxobutanoate hydroxymethyltransferase
VEAHRARISLLKDRKQRGERFAMLTAYDATMARLIERAGVDVLLVGDSVATAVLGYGSTLPVTLEAMIHHTAAVRRGTERALIVADMPFLTYQVTAEDAVRNAGRLVKEGGAAAVKVEGGRVIAGTVRRLVDVGIPVMGHVGLLPQSVNQQSGYRQRGAETREADAIHADALALQDAGAFAVVLEAIPADLARTITKSLDIPTIGIGAGPECDGQVLVSHDMLGLNDRRVPPFVKRYADLAAAVTAAVQAYVNDVQERRFPEVAAPAGASAVARDRAD